MGRPPAHQLRPASPPPEAILVVDDDPNIVESTELLLLHLGLQIHKASTGQEALTIARAQRLALVLLDQRLPDMPGLEVAETFLREGISVPWILMSGFMDFELATKAGRLGAICAVSSPFDVEDVVTRALADIRGQSVLAWPLPPLGPRLKQARSAAERWARFVLLACDAEEDLPTIRDWAWCIAVGYGTLRESCDMVGVLGHDARDFMRILRVLVRTSGNLDRPEAHLKFSDQRTVDALLTRSGLSEDRSRKLSLEEFLVGQRFISLDGPAIKAIRVLLADL